MVKAAGLRRLRGPRKRLAWFVQISGEIFLGFLFIQQLIEQKVLPRSHPDATSITALGTSYSEGIHPLSRSSTVAPDPELEAALDTGRSGPIATEVGMDCLTFRYRRSDIEC